MEDEKDTNLALPDLASKAAQSVEGQDAGQSLNQTGRENEQDRERTTVVDRGYFDDQRSAHQNHKGEDHQPKPDGDMPVDEVGRKISVLEHSTIVLALATLGLVIIGGVQTYALFRSTRSSDNASSAALRVAESALQVAQEETSASISIEMPQFQSLPQAPVGYAVAIVNNGNTAAVGKSCLMWSYGPIGGSIDKAIALVSQPCRESVFVAPKSMEQLNAANRATPASFLQLAKNMRGFTFYTSGTYDYKTTFGERRLYHYCNEADVNELGIVTKRDECAGGFGESIISAAPVPRP